MHRPTFRSFSSEDGQTLVEYILILGLVSVGALLALTALGGTLSGVFNDVAAIVNSATP